MVFGSEKKKAAKKDKPAKKEAAANAEEEGVIGEQVVESTPPPDAADAAKQASGQQAPPPLTAKTVTGPQAEEIYVDGISSLSFRANVVKLDCYRVVGQDLQANTESRMVAHRLVMPSAGLQELIQLLQNASERQRKRAAAEAGKGKAD